MVRGPRGFFWTRWSYTIVPSAKMLPLPGMPPLYTFIITGFPMTSFVLNSENVWRAHREPVTRLGSIGRAPTIPSTARNTVFAKCQVMEHAPFLPHFFWPCCCWFYAAAFPTPPPPCETLRPLRHAAISSHSCNIPPHRRVIQRVLQSSSLKHHEGASSAPASIPACAGSGGVPCRVRSRGRPCCAPIRI